MHFSGKIQGDFIITTEEKSAEIALRNKGILAKSGNGTDTRNYIADYFTEILNVSSGNSLPELEKKYGILSLTPPSVIFGELRLSQVISGNVDICNGSDLIRCTLSINLSGLVRKM
jgi:CheY-specific phosphatase CheX